MIGCIVVSESVVWRKFFTRYFNKGKIELEI